MCVCVCVKRGKLEAGGWQTKVRELREEWEGGGGGGGGGAKADSREGKLRRGTVEWSEKREEEEEDRTGQENKGASIWRSSCLGYEVLVRSRGNRRKLECCGEEVDSWGKERRGKSETGVIFTFFFFFSLPRETETSGGSDAGLQLGWVWGESVCVCRSVCLKFSKLSPSALSLYPAFYPSVWLR